MRDWLRLWFSIARPVGRLPYALTGFGLMPIKFAGDAALIYLATGAAWSPLGYLTPRLASTWAVLAGDRPWLVAALLLWTLPFLWIGASMTMRRGLDAGFPGAAGLLFFLPVVNYVWMLTLCAFPTARLGRRIDEAPAARASVRLELVAAMPAAVLGLASAAAMSRFVRAGLLQALGQEFIRAARARGLGGGRVMFVHALRNALIPVINLIGLSLPILISGSLITEVVFAWPGMGRLTYEAIRSQDLSIVLAATMLATLLVLLGSLAADLAMALVDPRIRLSGRRSDR